MQDDDVERVARAIMQEVYGGCEVVDWAEVQWNPAVAKAMAAARAIIPMVLQHAAQKVESLMECDGLIDADEAAAAIRAIGAP